MPVPFKGTEEFDASSVRLIRREPLISYAKSDTSTSIIRGADRLWPLSRYICSVHRYQGIGRPGANMSTVSS